MTPTYSDGALTGFELTYTDASGNQWFSHQSSVNIQDVTFSDIAQESDSTGDYSKFICVFDCYVYKQDAITLAWDSLRVQATEMQGWFKK